MIKNNCSQNMGIAFTLCACASFTYFNLQLNSHTNWYAAYVLFLCTSATCTTPCYTLHLVFHMSACYLFKVLFAVVLVVWACVLYAGRHISILHLGSTSN